MKTKPIWKDLGFRIGVLIQLIIALFLISIAFSSQAKAKQSDIECLTEAIYFEARGEPFIGQLAVANVIMERVRDHRFPPTVCEVVHDGRYWEGNPIRNRCAF